MIYAWSDGKVKNGEGAHAYTLRTGSDDQTECIVCSSMTPGDPKSICSLRTEHYGAFGIALLAQILCIRHSITATEGYLNFFIDNDTVIKRLKYGIRPEMGSTKYCKTDYDIDSIFPYSTSFLCIKKSKFIISSLSFRSYVKSENAASLCMFKFGLGTPY